MAINNNTSRTSITKKIIYIFGFLLISAMVFPSVSSSIAYAQSPEAKLKAIQRQQAHLKTQELILQQELQSLSKQVVDARKNTLSTVGFVKPTLSAAQYDKVKTCATNQSEPAINSSAFLNHWQTYLTNFNCGHITQTFANNNTALREFVLTARDNHGLGIPVPITLNKTDAVMFPSWSFNSSVPGPTMRVTQGDHVRITVINSNESRWSHSMHMHSIHSGANDGVTGQGGSIPPGGRFVYEFIARGGAAGGVYPYHCHMSPIQQHLMRGLYGMFIIDGPIPRPAAKEMVMVMNGYSFNQINLETPTSHIDPVITPPTAQQLREATADFGIPSKTAEDDNNNNNNPLPIIPEQQQQPQQQADDDNKAAKAKDEALDPGGGEAANDNQFYTVNGMAFGYTLDKMIEMKTNQTYRIFVENVVEFDPVNSFHLHGNMFAYYPSGTSMRPDFIQDIITLGQGDRGIMEFAYHLPGSYMFHAHINRFADLGWMGFFHLT